MEHQARVDGEASTGARAAPAIAVVVATHRRPDAIATLMRSLARQTLPTYLFEVAVAVDGHDEFEPVYSRILEDARDRLGIALTYSFHDNTGPGGARDRAIAATTAPWLCITDDDMDPLPGYLQAHLEALERGGKGTVVIGNVIPEIGWEQQPLYEAVRTYSMLTLHDGLRRGTRRAQGAAVVTQNVSLARSAYDRVGGFDKTLRLGEDIELGWRLERAGALFVFVTEAAAIHRSRVGSYDTWLQRQFSYGRNAVYIHRKLDGDPRSHPLRNLLNGHRAKRALVELTCWSDALARAGISVLHGTGDLLQRLHWTRAAVATHKGIMAIAYHLGVKEALGSWTQVRAESRAFLSTPDRPTDGT